MNKRFFPILISAASLVFLSQSVFTPVRAESTNAPAPPSLTSQTSENVPAADAFRAYLQLQEQLHETQLAVERSEREMELATLKSAAILSNRLQAIEHTVEMQRNHELDMVRDMMLITGTFVVIGVFALLLTSYFHWRAVSRLGEIAAAFPNTRGLGNLSAVGALGLNDHSLLLEQTNTRLLASIERLEKRMAELESGDVKNLTNGSASAVNREPSDAQISSEMSLQPAQTKTGTIANQVNRDQLALLLDRGNALLSEDQVEQAIACFDEALLLDPRHTESLVKKGDALEKLRRTKEALECYDRALAIDNSMTIAYLHKGGLLNRVERFDEAMHCYEQALRTQTKERAA